jgi:hypothetical protein
MAITARNAPFTVAAGVPADFTPLMASYNQGLPIVEAEGL